MFQPKNIYKWAKFFKDERSAAENEGMPEKLLEVRFPEMIKKVNYLIQ